MTKIKVFAWCLILVLTHNNPLFGQNWKAKWIGLGTNEADTANSWVAFRKDFQMEAVPKKAVARIAVDSKYWLYINDKLVVFEGGLKRGPNKNDTYFDEVDLSNYLIKGANTIAVKVWYFGKHGFSHNSSGKLGLLFDLQTDATTIVSDSTWLVQKLKEYQTAAGAVPNFRLAESNILFDARQADTSWHLTTANPVGFVKAASYGAPGIAPWNHLVKRPIPLWKDFGLKEFAPSSIIRKGDTVICKLPYNMQFTPYFDIESEAGILIKLFTDNYSTYNGSTENIRATYITKGGRQQYESLGWMNGHLMYFVLPANARIHSLKYRETGYDTDFAGAFESSDPFFNNLWKKANRTLYVTMRDTYMDCPDRERAQWTGDAVLEAQEAFYALCPKSHALAKKWLYELIHWQKVDGTLFAPIPAGNWDKELPDQILASIGYYGLWTYYMHTADRQILVDLYPGIRKYISLWEKDKDGLVLLREGGWQWGDWGENKDMLLLYNLWYYLALKGSYLTTKELGYTSESKKLLEEMQHFKEVFNTRFWNGSEYRDPLYKKSTDDRVHALAVLAGIADRNKYVPILKVFANQEHASPYMEKYVFEAMYKMNEPILANRRHKKRFAPMVNNAYFSTLFEGWGIGNEGYGGGTVNHAWSGGGLTILSSELCGIKPLQPGYSLFQVAPQMGDVSFAKAKVSTVKGVIEVSVNNTAEKRSIDLTVPAGTKAVVLTPSDFIKKILINNNDLEKAVKKLGVVYDKESKSIVLPLGHWTIDFGF